MSTARIPDGTPLGLVQVGLTANGIESTCAYVDMSTIPQPGRSDPPVKPTSEVAHQPGQQPAAITGWYGEDDCPTCQQWRALRARLKAQRRSARGETKSAGDTTGGARGGTRLGNPCDEDGLTR